MCTRTVGVLAHVFEAAGLATVGISLVRDQAVNARAPRMLNVDFPLGRPLGRPGDAAFQHDVLARAFALLDRTDVPVLVDHPETIEDQAAEPAACPLPPRHDPDLPAAIDEAIGLRGAYERNVAATQRTLVGRVAAAEAIPTLIEAFLRIEAGESLGAVGWDEWTALAASQDLRAYYEEAALQLSATVGPRQGDSWFYTATETGKLLRRLAVALRDTDAPDIVAQYLVPMSQR